MSIITPTIRTVAYICIMDKKLLLVRSKNKKVFYMPGGKRENGESDKEALIREIKEELSVDLIENSLKHYKTFQAQSHGAPPGVHVQIMCFTGNHTGEPVPSSEIEEVRFFSTDEYFIMEEVAPAGRLIIMDLKKKNLIF